MEPEVRLTRPTDINTIRDLDIKCYDYPLEMDDWKELLNNSGKENKSRVVIVEGHRKSLGFGVWKMLPPEVGVNEQVCALHRLGVKPGKYRGKGLGKLLIKTCEAHAIRMQADLIRYVAPDFKCNKDDEDDISGFLSLVEFYATGVIVPSYKFMYGRWVDGFVFEKQLRGVSAC